VAFFQLRNQGTFRTFIAAWLCFIVLVVAVPSLAIFITGEQLKRYTDRIRSDSRATELTYMLESAVLARCREDMQYRLKQVSSPAFMHRDTIRTAETSLKELDLIAEPGQDTALVKKITERYRTFEEAVAQKPPKPTESINHLADEILNSLSLYRKHHRARVMRGLRHTVRLDRYVEMWPALLVFMVAVISGIGATVLLQRIAGPALELSRVAERFGQGDYTARVSVKRTDELGRLCATFNNMADDIAHRETERLNLIASLAHDIKNPLVVAGGNARLLQRKPDSDKRNQWADTIVRQIGTIEAIVNDLMDSVQVETGNISLNIREVDMAVLMRSIQSEYGDLFSGCQIIYEGDETCLVPCDEHRIERVLVNLISNAIKYSPAQSPIFLKAFKNDWKAVVSIKDQGVGIEQEDLPILFQPFGRIRRTQQMTRGNGLGLFVVKKIVEAHNGTITVMSKPGSGTTFEMILPTDVGVHGVDARVGCRQGSHAVSDSALT